MQIAIKIDIFDLWRTIILRTLLSKYKNQPVIITPYDAIISTIPLCNWKGSLPVPLVYTWYEPNSKFNNGCSKTEFHISSRPLNRLRPSKIIEWCPWRYNDTNISANTNGKIMPIKTVLLFIRKSNLSKIKKTKTNRTARSELRDFVKKIKYN